MSRNAHEQTENNWKNSLDDLFRRIGAVALGEGCWIVLRAGSRLVLALPKDRTAARVVIGMYQPHRITGRLFRAVAHGIMASGRWHLLPRITLFGSGLPLVPWLQDSAKHGTLGFLGCNPVHGPRCIIGGIDPATGEPLVAKLGMDASAASVVREHEVLQSLHGRYEGILPSLGLERGEDWALMRLPHLGEHSPSSMIDPVVSRLLESWLGEEMVALGESPFVRHLLDQVAPANALSGWHDRVKKLRVRKALVHGDFAVWNTRYALSETGQRTGRLIAFDWEWAQEDGVAGIDLVHGLRQEAYLIKRLSAKDAVAWMLHQLSGSPWKQYGQKSGWEGEVQDLLTLGLLHSHFNAKNPSEELLAELGFW